MKKEDTRTIKTKAVLKKSFNELLKTNTFEKITVSEICKCAYINRVTFYTHYPDKYALCQDMLNDLILTIEKQTKENMRYSADPKETLLSFMDELVKSIINICYDSKEIISAFGNQENSMLVSMINTFSTSQGLTYFKEIEKVGNLKCSYSEEYVITFLVSGFSKIVFEWIRNPHRISKEEFINCSADFVKKIIYSNLLFDDTPKFNQ